MTEKQKAEPMKVVKTDSVSEIKAEPTTEERILKAAEAEFMNKGFDGARTTIIAQNAGVTHAMFHYYFRTKKNLFERIVAEKAKALQGLIISTLRGSTQPLKERLKSAICNHLDFLAKNPDLPRFLIMEIYTDRERMDTLLSQFAGLASAVIGELQMEIDACAAKGDCRKVDARMLMLDIISLNMFSFLASPVVNVIMNGEMEADLTKFIDERKKENVETLLNRLKMS